ncbi:MAG: DUF6691 family protein [Candidatus Sericytochromatia bacterium]
MKALFSAFVSGLIFALGLGLSGMMNPTKVQGFLDLGGQFDPSLGLVMGGAVALTLIGFPLITRRKAPLFEAQFSLPTSVKVDRPLLLGAVLFGAGWAISGLCPGPALANLPSLNGGVWIYTATMLLGWWLYPQVSHWLIHRHSHSQAEETARLKAFDQEQCVID